MLQAHTLGPLALHFVDYVDSFTGNGESGGEPLLHPEPFLLQHIALLGQWW